MSRPYNTIQFNTIQYNKRTEHHWSSAPASPIQRVGRSSCPFLPPLCPFNICSLFQLKHQTLHFGENRTKIKKRYQYLIFDCIFLLLIIIIFQKTGFYSSCKLSPLIYMKCQILFSGKNKKNKWRICTKCQILCSEKKKKKKKKKLSTCMSSAENFIQSAKC